MTTTFWWHEQADGGVAGPFTEDDIRRLLADGGLSAQARVWSSRQEPWPPKPASPAARRLAFSGRSLAGCGLGALGLLGWLQFGLVVTMIATHGAKPWSLEDHPWSLPAAGAVLGLIAAAMGALGWTLPHRLGSGPERIAGLRIAALLMAAAWLLPVVMVVRDTPLVFRQAEALRRWGFLISAGADPNTLVVQGPIGVGFSEKLTRRLAAVPDPARIIIESPGGLVDEALAAAKTIERRRVAVVVGSQCASACIIVLMAGKERLAPLQGSIMFHATSPVVDSSNALANWLAGQEGERSRAYLLGKGVPAADLDEARRRGPGDVFAVPDVAALRQGVLTGLYDDDGELDRDAGLGGRLPIPPAR